MTRSIRGDFNVKIVRKDRVLHWLMRIALLTKQMMYRLADQEVLLAGDAAYPMPIITDQGGRSAMKDGMALAEL